jgi:hypothetical protein
MLAALVAIVLLPMAIGQRGATTATAQAIAPAGAGPLAHDTSDGWTLFASSPSNAPLALGGSPLGDEASAAQHAWLLVRGAKPPARMTAGGKSQGAQAQPPGAQSQTTEPAPATATPTPPPLFPDLRQPATLLHIGPATRQSEEPVGVARTLAIFPTSPDAIASTSDRIALAFVDRPQSSLPLPPTSTQPAARTLTPPASPTPPRITTVVEYRAIAGQAGEAWALSPRVRQLAPLPAARAVLSMAYATPFDRAGVVAREPVLFALLGPALDNPARAPNTELFVLEATGWQSAHQPWIAVVPEPSTLATVPGGVALLSARSSEALIAALPAPAATTPRAGWLKLQEDEDWTVGQRSSVGPTLPLAKQLQFRTLSLPALAPQSRHAGMLWAGDQLVLLTQRAEGEGELLLSRLPASQFVSLLPKLADASESQAMAAQASDASAPPPSLAWSPLARLAAFSPGARPPHLLGVPGHARVLLASPTQTTTPLGIVPHHAMQVSLATGLEFERGALAIMPPATGADLRLFGFALAYALGMIAVLLAPKASKGLVLPKHASMASPARRFSAGLIDFLLAVVLGSVLVGVSPAEVATSSIEALLLTREGQGIVLAILGVAVIFNASLESLTGRSVGKFLCGIGVARLVPASPLPPRKGFAKSSNTSADDQSKAEAEGDAPSDNQQNDTPDPSVPPQPDDNAFLAPPLHRSLVRNLVKWCLFPLGFIAAIRPGASHRGDDLAQSAVIDPSIDEDD